MTNQEKPIPGYTRYVVSSFGYVRKLGSRTRNYGTMNNRGYVLVNLRGDNGRYKVCGMSRLVAEAFLPNPDHKPQVDHIDTNRRNNRADNLRWVTQHENNANLTTRLHKLEKPLPWKGGSGPKGVRATMCDGTVIHKRTMKEMAQYLGCSPGTVSRVAHGEQPALYGCVHIEPRDWDVRQGKLNL